MSMTTPPPPPPGNGPDGNPPYDPSGSTPGSGQAGPPPPSYGSAPGQPPQAPPPAPGGAPQDGGKGKTMAIISIVTGVIGCCCFPFSIVAVVLGILARKDFANRGESATLANIGLAIGVIGLVLTVISWILQGTGVIDVYSFNFETS